MAVVSRFSWPMPIAKLNPKHPSADLKSALQKVGFNPIHLASLVTDIQQVSAEIEIKTPSPKKSTPEIQ